MLDERSQRQKRNTVLFHFYNILENAHESNDRKHISGYLEVRMEELMKKFGGGK